MNQHLFTKIMLAPIFFTLLTGCTASTTSDTNQDTTDTVAFSALSSIVVTLEWADEYGAAKALKNLFPVANAALPPEYQDHYELSLVFDHNAQTISDTYKFFTGEDSTSMTTSTVTRDSAVYNQISQYMQTTYVCTVTAANEGWAGPAQPAITFTTTTTTLSGILFSDDPSADTGDQDLCSEVFGDYLLSLLTNRDE